MAKKKKLGEVSKISSNCVELTNAVYDNMVLFFSAESQEFQPDELSTSEAYNHASYSFKCDEDNRAIYMRKK